MTLIQPLSVRPCQDKINQLGHNYFVEKSTPHCKLSVVQSLVERGQVLATATAFSGARDLGINDMAGLFAVVMSLTTANFYKSMTTFADHRIRQDGYHAKTTRGDEVYLKQTVIDDVLIVSLKKF